jgi:outer membrane protein assembly factor BamB
MSPRQLIEKLESLGIIDPKIIDKIRKEIDNPEKTVKPKAVLNYLVKKKQITEKQAIQILKAKPTEDEIEVVQQVEKSYDTDDLTGLKPEEPVNEVVAEPEIPEVPVSPVQAYDATMIDDGGLASQVDPDIVVSSVLEPQPFADEIVHEVAPLDLGMDGVEAAGGFDQGFESGGYDQQSGEQKVLPSFSGKRNKKDQWATKWLYIGFGILGTLLIGTGVLWIVNSGQSAEDMYAAAMDSFNKPSYADAVKKFEEFLERFPDNKEAPMARAKRVHAIVRGTYNLKNYPEVLQQAETLLPDLTAEGEKLSELRDDLAVMLPRSLAEISNKGAKLEDLTAMESELTKVEDFFTIVDNPVYIPNSLRKKTSIANNYLRIDNNIKLIKGQINKEKRYNSDLTKIGEFRETKETDKALAVYQELTRKYSDLAAREDLLEMMVSISQTEQELVVPIEMDIATSNQERPTILQSSVVLATKTGTPVPGLKEEIVSFLADGSVYGVDAGDGTIVWRRFVGFETSHQPVSIDEGFIAVSNQRQHELAAIDKRTGKLKWRTEINEPFMPPTIGEQVVVVTTESGKVIELNANTGVVNKAVKLPHGTNVSAMVATRDPFVYQAGIDHYLYSLNNKDYKCEEVHYLGHYEGSITTPPQAWTGFILVVINKGNFCNLHVLKPKAKGLGLELVQVITSIVEGSVSRPMEKFKRWMLITSDSGEMKILELYPAEEKNPVRVFTQDVFDAKGSQLAFLKAEGSDLWVAGQGIMRYRIKQSLGEFGREVLLEPNDTFISPIQKLDDYVLHVRKRNQSGMISVSLVDAKTLLPVWRTDFAGELASPPLKYGNQVVAVNNQGDLFAVSAENEAKGFNDTPVRSSDVLEDLQFNQSVELTDDMFAVVGPTGKKDFLLAQGTTGKSKLLSLQAPADKLATRPLALDGSLIMPTTSGEVVRINPANGRMQGTPFQPPIFANAEKPKWFEPTMIGNGIFAIASSETADGTKSMMYVLSGEDQSVVKKVAELELEASIKSRLINDGKNIFGVVDGENGDKLTAFPYANPLTIGPQTELSGSIVDGPWLVGDSIIVLMDDDQIYCYGTDLAGKWKIEVANEKLACTPEVVNSQVMLCFRNGKVQLIDPATGKPGTEFDLGQPIIHKPLRAAGKMYFSGLDGTVHVADLNKLPQ